MYLSALLLEDSVGAKKIGVGNFSAGAFRRRIVRFWHPLGCRAIELGKQPQGGVIKHCRINSTSIEGHTAVVDTSASKGAVRRAGTRIGQVRAQRRTRYYTASPGVCHFLGRNLLAG